MIPWNPCDRCGATEVATAWITGYLPPSCTSVERKRYLCQACYEYVALRLNLQPGRSCRPPIRRHRGQTADGIKVEDGDTGFERAARAIEDADALED